MSLRPIRLAAGLLVTGLAFGMAPAAPALADGITPPPVRHHVRHHVRHRVWHAPRVVTVERVRVVKEFVPRIVYVPQPVTYYATACGGCSTPVAYAPAPRPLPTYYYSGSCGGCGYGVARSAVYYSSTGYVGASRYADDEEYAPVYTRRYSTGYTGDGYIRPRFRVSTRYATGRAGFRRGFSSRSFYGRRTGRFH